MVIILSAYLVTTCWIGTCAGTGGGGQPPQQVHCLLKDAVVVGCVPREFSLVFWHSSGTVGLSHVELLYLSLSDKATSHC